MSLKAPVSSCKPSLHRKGCQKYFNFPELHFTPSHHFSPLQDVANREDLLSPSANAAYSPFMADMVQRQQKGGEGVGSRARLTPTKDAISIFWESQQQSAAEREKEGDPVSLYNQHMAPLLHTGAPKPTGNLENGSVFHQTLPKGPHPARSTHHVHTWHQPSGMGLATSTSAATPLSPEPRPSGSDDTPPAGEGGWHPSGHLVYED